MTEVAAKGENIGKNESCLENETDYGVWGDVLREQKADESTYRFGYQGQFSERDLETGWNHFELREYDPIIGRFLVMDPAGEFWSPYVGMGNNPINLTDPTGGSTDCPKCDAADGQWGALAEEYAARATPIFLKAFDWETLIDHAGANLEVVLQPGYAYKTWEEFNDANNKWISQMGATNYHDALEKYYKGSSAYRLDMYYKGRDMMWWGTAMTYTLSVTAFGRSTLSAPTKFSPTPRLTGRSSLYHKLYFVDSRGPSYFSQPEHAKFPENINRWIIQDGVMEWRPNRTYAFTIGGYRNGSAGTYSLGVRPDGGIMHSAFYKFK